MHPHTHNTCTHPAPQTELMSCSASARRPLPAGLTTSDGHSARPAQRESGCRAVCSPTCFHGRGRGAPGQRDWPLPSGRPPSLCPAILCLAARVKRREGSSEALSPRGVLFAAGHARARAEAELDGVSCTRHWTQVDTHRTLCRHIQVYRCSMDTQGCMHAHALMCSVATHDQRHVCRCANMCAV